MAKLQKYMINLGDAMETVEVIKVSELKKGLERARDSICLTDITGYYMGRLDVINHILADLEEPLMICERFDKDNRNCQKCRSGKPHKKDQTCGIGEECGRNIYASCTTLNNKEGE